MNSKNETFSLNRFWNLFKYDFNNNKLYYIATIPVAMFGIGFVLWLNFPGEITKNGYNSTSLNFGISSYTFPLFLGYFIYGIIIIGNSFPSLKNERKTLKYLLLPASTFEKFLLQWGIRVFLFLILYPLLFKFTANITGDIYLGIHKYYISQKGFQTTMFPEISKFTFSHYYNEQPKAKILFLIVGILWSLGASLLFLGATYLKNWNLFLGPICITALIFIIYLYLVLLSNFINPDPRHFWNITLKGDKPVFFNDEIPLILISAMSIGIILSFVSWATAYYRLKEREV
ncbi:hypothetical protein [Echinicola salinicaeni]|uniref:hypothetical protein n=1 Tax=Echinicola salinicaeni TaxID=2762757 RepID=UPI0016447108|nr:hypothetical protein [Echinicola salinicaeni]